MGLGKKPCAINSYAGARSHYQRETQARPSKGDESSAWEQMYITMMLERGGRMLDCPRTEGGWSKDESELTSSLSSSPFSGEGQTRIHDFMPAVGKPTLVERKRKDHANHLCTQAVKKKRVSRSPTLGEEQGAHPPAQAPHAPHCQQPKDETISHEAELINIDKYLAENPPTPPRRRRDVNREEGSSRGLIYLCDLPHGTKIGNITVRKLPRNKSWTIEGCDMSFRGEEGEGEEEEEVDPPIPYPFESTSPRTSYTCVNSYAESSLDSEMEELLFIDSLRLSCV